MSSKTDWRRVAACCLFTFSWPAVSLATELTGAAEATGTMAHRVDQRIDQKLAEQGITPQSHCEDAEFLRRVCLDLTGVIPTAAQAREFLADERPDKRAVWIDRLLASPRHATHLAITWRRMMLPSDFDPAQLTQAAGLQNWLRAQFVTNLRYDRLVAEFLAATGDEQSGPALFYRTLNADPGKLAAATSRIFLGLQIQCAECHDHPYDDWKQTDFWGYAAFFAQVQPSNMMVGDRFRLVDLASGEVMLPETEEVVLPKYPGGEAPGAAARGTRRRQLAIWMASGDNPYLAPAAVNRIWGQMFGRGLVNPIDDLGRHNLASHPQLLSDLAEFLVEQQFDLRSLYRTLANTEAYQRRSVAGANSSEQMAWFAGMPVKRLTADQLFDSLQQSLATYAVAGEPADVARSRFVAMMESSSRDVTEYDLGLQQALHLMNGPEIAQATGGGQGTLAAIQAPFWNNTQRIEILYLATLSRFPRADEAEMLARYLASATDGPEQALSDMLWALVNSAEYQFNH